MPQLPDFRHLSHTEKDPLIRALWQRLEAAEQRIANLEARLGEPSKTPDNSSLPPSKGQKPTSRRRSNVSGRASAAWAAKAVNARPASCAHCQAALTDADQVLHGRYDKIDLPVVRPVVTRVERYAGHCTCCGGVTLAAIPAGLDEGSPFSVNIVALQAFRHVRVPRRNAGLALYPRFTHAINYRRRTQLFQNLYALRFSEGALDAMLQRARPRFDNEVLAILDRLRRSRVAGSDETSVRIDGRTL